MTQMSEYEPDCDCGVNDGREKGQVHLPCLPTCAINVEDEFDRQARTMPEGPWKVVEVSDDWPQATRTVCEKGDTPSEAVKAAVTAAARAWKENRSE